MPTPRSVSNIKSNLLRPALTSHFEVEIPIPQDAAILSSVLGGQQEKLNLSCSEVSLPGSQLTTLELTSDRTGVTEKHAYRRMFDDRIDLTFYVDAENYLPIRFFETWIGYIVNENSPEFGALDRKSSNYFYRSKYPDEYIAQQGLIVRKFERDYKQSLEYEFIRTFPLAISSMPVSYESSSLLKCTVSMSYVRYVINNLVGENPDSNAGRPRTETTGGIPQQAANNSANALRRRSPRERDINARATFDPRFDR